jgi:hypothetical protein
MTASVSHQILQPRSIQLCKDYGKCVGCNSTVVGCSMTAQIGALSVGTAVRPLLFMRSGQPGVTVQLHVSCLIRLRNSAKIQPYAHYNFDSSPVCLMIITAKCTPTSPLPNIRHIFAAFSPECFNIGPTICQIALSSVKTAVGSGFCCQFLAVQLYAVCDVHSDVMLVSLHYM